MAKKKYGYLTIAKELNDCDKVPLKFFLDKGKAEQYLVEQIKEDLQDFLECYLDEDDKEQFEVIEKVKTMKTYKEINEFLMEQRDRRIDVGTFYYSIEELEYEQ